MYIILPINKWLYKYLLSVEEGMFGDILINIVLTGFLQRMLIADFDLRYHLSEIDMIDGITGSESEDFKREAEIAITQMVIKLRRHFPGTRLKGVKIYKAYFTRRSLRFEYDRE